MGNIERAEALAGAVPKSEGGAYELAQAVQYLVGRVRSAEQALVVMANSKNTERVKVVVGEHFDKYGE